MSQRSGCTSLPSLARAAIRISSRDKNSQSSHIPAHAQGIRAHVENHADHGQSRAWSMLLITTVMRSGSPLRRHGQAVIKAVIPLKTLRIIGTPAEMR